MKIQNEEILNNYLKSNNIKANYLFINDDFLYIINSKKIINIKNNPNIKDHLLSNNMNYLYIDKINNNFILKDSLNKDKLLMSFFIINNDNKKIKVTKQSLMIYIRNNTLLFGTVNNYIEEFDSGFDIFNTFELFEISEQFITQTQLISMIKDFTNMEPYSNIMNMYKNEGFNIEEFFYNTIYNKRNVDKYIDSRNIVLYFFIFIENLRTIANNKNIKKINYDKDLFLFMTFKYSLSNNMQKDANILITFQGALSTIIIFDEIIKSFKNNPDNLKNMMHLTNKFFTVLIKEMKSNNEFSSSNKDTFLDNIDDNFFLIGYSFIVNTIDKDIVELQILNNLLSSYLEYDYFNQKDYFEAIKYIKKISENNNSNIAYYKLVLSKMYNDFIVEKSHIYKEYISIAFIYHLQNSLINNKITPKNIPKIKKALDLDLINIIYTQTLILKMSDIDENVVPLIQSFLNLSPVEAIKLLNEKRVF